MIIIGINGKTIGRSREISFDCGGPSMGRLGSLRLGTTRPGGVLSPLSIQLGSDPEMALV